MLADGARARLLVVEAEKVLDLFGRHPYAGIGNRNNILTSAFYPLYLFIAEGGSVTYTITPFTNYKIESVLVNGVNQGNITTYTFEDIRENGTIHVVFVEEVGVSDNKFANVQVYSYHNTVYIKNTDNVALKSVEIFDMLGRAIYRAPLVEQETVIALQTMTGIYHVLLTAQDNSATTTKIVLR